MSKSVLITGASQGIGLATALEFLEKHEGLEHLVVVSRDSKHFNEAVELLKSNNKNGVKIHQFHADLSDLDVIAPMVEKVRAEVGNIDVLVNNAGYTNPVPLHQSEIEDFRRTMDVNLYAPFLIVKDFLNAGNTFELIVNLASTAGITGRSGWLTYSASKAAMINMSQVMREELAIFGTRVACISPGRCATALRRTLAPDEDPTTIMQPEHVAEIIAVLATDAGKSIDSQNMVVRR